MNAIKQSVSLGRFVFLNEDLIRGQEGVTKR
jgi:hypothetical protein